MKFSGKMCLEMILKVTKNQAFTLSLEDTFFKKSQGMGVQFDPPPSPPSDILEYSIKRHILFLENYFSCKASREPVTDYNVFLFQLSVVAVPKSEF